MATLFISIEAPGFLDPLHPKSCPRKAWVHLYLSKAPFKELCFRRSLPGATRLQMKTARNPRAVPREGAVLGERRRVPVGFQRRQLMGFEI